MTENYFHGVKIEEKTDGLAGITLNSKTVIGIVGSAVQGEENVPVLIKKAIDITENFGEDSESHTLVRALKAIFLNASPLVVAVRSDAAGDLESKTGVYALLKASSSLGYVPNVILAPGIEEVDTALEAVAKKLKAVALLDAATQAEAATKASSNSSSRLFLCTPSVVGEGKIGTIGLSAFAAGVIAATDAKKGFYVSPSNKPIMGIDSLTEDVDWSLSDENSDANELNKKGITTVIKHNGFRLWGNRTLGKTQDEDKANVFINVRRITDSINTSIQQSMLDNIDKNISREYVQNVTESVNSFLRRMRAVGAIINGYCWASEEDNTAKQIKQGKLTLSFDYTPSYPADQIKFKSIITEKYIKEIF
ncbi:MAG: phage tail sheath family protein [Oligoflexales bacterium]